MSRANLNSEEVEDRPEGWIDPAKIKLTEVGAVNMWPFRALNEIEVSEGGYNLF